MFNYLIYILILIFGISSYVVGSKEIITGKYSPSLFSRIIWVFLAINSFAGIILSGGTKSSVLLGSIFLLGNITICILSFHKGVREFGKIEMYTLSLLLISILIWIFFDAPLVNLLISLFAHFIGGIPTYKRVWINPKTESFGFWSLFFVSSFLSVLISDFTSIKEIVFPLYFMIFDGVMTLLTLRKK